ncbi:MAG: extracellular solute-binding protein [Anaerolineae bacterium]|nr:extracellular solute-binding protein [Anaerolineae bacterium]
MNRKHTVLLIVLVAMLLAMVPVAAQSATEIKMWIAFTDNRLDWAKQKAEVFNAAFPQYNVVVEGYSNYEELFNATNLAAEQNALPAIVQYFEVASQNAIDSGYFKPIAQALGDRTEVNGIPAAFDDFIGPVAAYYTINGQFNSMPWNASSSIMFSNMNILKAAGVDTPPATWAEVEAACAMVMAMDGAPEFCFTWPNHGWFFEQWLAQQGATYANNDNGRAERATEVAFNNEAAVALMTWMKDMKDKGYLYYSGARNGDSWATVDQAFQGQQVAMAVYSSSDTAIYTNTGKENGYEVAASFMPYNQDAAGGWTGNLIGGASLWLVDGLSTEVEDGALTWLFWMNNTENAAEWHQVTGYLPVRLSAVELLNTDGWYDAIAPIASQVWMNDPAVQGSQGKVWFVENPNFAVAADQLAKSQQTVATSGALMGDFPAIRNIVTQAIDTILLTPDSDPAAVLAAASAEANIKLGEYNTLNAG